MDEFFKWLSEEGGVNHVKQLPTGKWAGLRPFLFTSAIVTGRLGDKHSYDDRWCYHTTMDAEKALAEWDGTGEPTGWHRHPASGRRVAEDGSEYVMP